LKSSFDANNFDFFREIWVRNRILSENICLHIRILIMNNLVYVSTTHISKINQWFIYFDMFYLFFSLVLRFTVYISLASGSHCGRWSVRCEYYNSRWQITLVRNLHFKYEVLSLIGNKTTLICRMFSKNRYLCLATS
jgi:hypothetical protein